MKRFLRDVTNKHWLVGLSVVMLATAVVSLLLASKELYATVRTQSASVEVAQQLESPLTIVITNITPSDPKAPKFSYEIVNTSFKAISAYAIRHDVAIGSSQSSGVMLTSMRSANALLYQQAKLEETFMGVTYAADISKVTLSVDFVEFDDGTVWGDDVFKMSEKLDGRRAGGRAALMKLRDLSKAQGQKAMLDALEGNINVTAQTDKSQLWKEGFEEGVRIVEVKIKHAKRKSGIAALEQKLLEPFDVSQRRQ